MNRHKRMALYLSEIEEEEKMKKRYLIYLDILGFEEKAKDIAQESGFDVGVIRENFLSIPLKNRIEEIKRKKSEISQGISEIEGSDNYILIVDEMETVFEVVGELTMIKIPHKEFGCIPLEVAADVREIDENVKIEPKYRDEVIEFLKYDIVSPYRKYYKSKHGDSTRETFILLTREFFDELEPLDKKACEDIPYGGKTLIVADVGKIQQRCKVIDFLRKIGYPNSRTYWRTDEVYIPPVEYEDIREMLKKENIVFITGTQEYGKTYTAVRLMWEFYNKGYEPVWIKGGEVIERNTVRQRLEEIRAELRPNRIIYFEDPFGKTKYEKREGLEKEIRTIIECIRRSNDVYVIITSREEVLKEFEKEMLSKNGIKEFEISLNLRTPSYNYEKRKELLLRWAENEGCIWLKNGSLRNPVLESMKKEEILPTPLRIKIFAFDTVRVETKNQLEEKIREKSQEIAMAFSREIKSMSDDKILFLAFLFISDYFEVGFIREMYKKVVGNLQLREAWEFDRILGWFKDDKVNVGGYLRFSHPTYSEALEYLLVEDSYAKRINDDIFYTLLVILSERVEATRDVAHFITGNFSILSEKVRNLLFKLAERDGVAIDVVWAVKDNFNRLPEDERSELLLRLAERDGAAEGVASAIADNFNALPEEVRNLLFKLAENDKVAEDVASAVTDNFYTLPGEVRTELLFKLAERDGAAGHIAWTIAENFYTLPGEVRNLLFKLAEKDGAAEGVASAIAGNFNTLPGEVRNLLFKLAERDGAARHVANVITGFHEIPEEVKNKLLLQLAEKDEAAGCIVQHIIYCFNTLPEEVRNLLFKLSERDGAARHVAEVMVYYLCSKMHYFYEIPEEVKNKLLLQLAEKDEAAWYVAHFIAGNFNTLPEEVRNLLFKLAERDGAAESVAWAVKDKFNTLPEDVKNRLLQTLAEKGITL
jgi:hypothetical protein